MDNNITTNQKIAVVVLLFFSVLVVFLWLIQFRNTLGLNDRPRTNVPIQNTSVSNPSINLQKDTDGDGLSDQDELNIYKTSPYLDDSDSDGFSDFEEISSENDPNCPVGRICATKVIDSDPTDEFREATKEMDDLANSIVGNNTNNNSTENINNILSGNTDAQTLRTLLINNAGVDAEALERISDEELLKVYKDILNEQ